MREQLTNTEHSLRGSINIIKNVVIWDPILRLTRNITGCYYKTRSERFTLVPTSLHTRKTPEYWGMTGMSRRHR